MLSIPGYRIESTIFESRKSLVFRAIREADGLPVVLKTPAQPYSPPERVARLRRELQITRELAVPGVIHAHGLESHDGRPVMVLEDFGAESLARWAGAAPRSPAERLEVAVQIADALGHLHRRKVMHKDVNPSNIVLTGAGGTLKLIDLGISTVLSRESTTLRSPDLVEGTLAYISPEQTGRMNRAIDYRTDFYSLGATLYELFSGAPPFEASDPVELIHAHIARPPVPLHERAPGVPRAVSDIVMKLLAKNAEDRYQSAHGIKADLSECLRQLQATGAIEPFPLGREDVSDRFQLPQKLYGREEEIEALLAAFSRASAGAAEMMLVSGHAGIGKSAVVREIYRPITRQRGYFIAGKFDQLQRNIPFASLVQAFQSLVRQLLSESEPRIAMWRRELLAALGESGQVIIDVIPEVQLIIGPQPPVPALAPKEAQNRFHHLLLGFIRVFARPEHPLVLFLDDLQWADGASLSMIEVLMSGVGSAHQLILGAYRDNEVGPAHPLAATVGAIRKAGGIVNEIRLRPLSLESVSELVADAVQRPREEVEALADLSFVKTDGNPFFLNEFLRSLCSDDLLRFDFQRGRWTWDIERIATADVTSNVVDLMAGKVKRLAPATQRVLKLAACVGGSFDLLTLATACEAPPQEIATDLWEAILEALILPLGDSYTLMSLDVQGLAEAVQAEYKFAHDRIQQAAYSLIPDGERQALHRRIGRLLLEGTPEDERERRVFDIVGHLNQGRSRVEGDAERLELARLNLIAGRKAKSSTAYRPALEYLKIGIELLGERGWARQHALALALHVEATEASCLATDFEEMKRLSSAVLEHADGILEKAGVYDLMLQAAIAQNRSMEAVETGLRVLSLLGVELPAQPDPALIGKSLGEAAEALRGVEIEQLADLPEMTDPHRLLELRFNNRILSPAFRVVPALFPVLLSRTITLLARHGNNAEAPFSYALYGLLLCAMGDIEAGHRFGQLSLKLLDRYPSRHIEARTRYIATAFIGHWKDPYHSAPGPLAEAHRLGIATGDFEFAGFCALMYCCFSYFTGASLEELVRDSATYIQAIAELKQETPLQYTRIHHQAMLNLQRGAADPCRLKGESYDEEAMMPVHVAANDMISLGYAALNRLILCCLFRDLRRGLDNADLAEQYLPSLAAMPHVALVRFYASLARLFAAPGMEEAERAAALEKVAASQEALEKLAQHAPENNLHRWVLVEAERARLRGDDTRAIEHYRRAIQLSRSHRFPHEEAIANESFAGFWLDRGVEEIAQVYLSRARQRYEVWGATAKVRDMDARHPWPSGRGAARAPTMTSSETSTTGATLFDLQAVMKASQAISREIVLADLFKRVMSIVIENAGASRGVLLLFQGDALFIEAERGVDEKDVTVLQRKPAGPGQKLALGVVNYVARTQQIVVLSDARHEGAFTEDPHVRASDAKSILGMPIVHQGKNLGVLYLENNLAAGAFTPDRVEVLELLCTQAAISLENVTLYRTLEEKVEQRTRELTEKTRELERALVQLKQMQQQIVTQEKMASLGALTAGIAHEIRNPLNFVINFSEASIELTGELGEQLSGASEDVKDTVDLLAQNARKIHEHGERASRIVSSMLAHSGASAARPEPTDIRALLDESLNLAFYGMRNMDPAIAIDVVKEHEGEIDPIHVVPQEVSRVFLNILNNACYSVREKAAELGAGYAPEIRVKTRALEGAVEIRLRDNGKGIPAAIKDRIFNPFFTTKPAGKGVGLGLSLSYDVIVQQHGGTFAVESAEGEYAELIVTLPR